MSDLLRADATTLLTAALSPGERVVEFRESSVAEITPTTEDRLAPFQQLILGLRWGAIAVAVILLVAGERRWDATTMAGIGALTAWTALRTVRPVRHYGDQVAVAVHIVADIALACGAVIATNHWDSPLAFCLLPGVVLGGFAQGGLLPVGLGLLVGSLTTLTEALNRPLTADQIRQSTQWIIELMLVGTVAGYAHKLLAESERRASVALDTMSRLTDANSLLTALHRVAQSLPASLDLEDVLTSTVTNARSLLETDGVAILLRDETLPSWLVARASGLRLPPTLDHHSLPSGVAEAVRTRQIVCLCDLPPDERVGLGDRSNSGIYAPLWARQQLIGVLAIEHSEAGRDGEATRELIARFVEPAALAIDNARWFTRIRTVAADEERVRIARDLHDRIGQSLAYIGFELDRVARAALPMEVASELKKLRADVRNVVAEVRETLYDIRTDVHESAGLIPTLASFLERVRERTSLTVTFDHQGSRPLPARQEREMWQIAQEAIVNVEKHAKASRLHVQWRSDGKRALLEIIDDGKGFATGSGRNDSYGLRGLRERASAIGARLEIHSDVGKGTSIRCRLEG